MVRFASVVLLAASFVIAGSAVALENPVVTGPSARAPGDNYPDAAVKAHVEGWAKVQCTVQATGRFADCVVMAEAPQGYGFGAAAAKSMTETGLADLTLDGPGKRVTRTAQFTLPGR